MAEQLIDCVIKRDFWDEDGKRWPAGKTVPLPVDAAIDGIESGALARVKPAAPTGKKA